MLKALIVEDNPLLRKYLCELLHTRHPDMRIVTACDGAGLIEKIESLKPDVVFMDVRLPGRNGIELTRQIRKTHADLPVVIVTSQNEPEYRDAAHAAGAAYFVQKDELYAHTVDLILQSLISQAERRPEKRPWRHGFAGWVGIVPDRLPPPRLAVALAAGMLALAIPLVLWKIPADTSRTYQTLATEGSMERFAKNDVLAVFADDMTPAEIGALVQSVHAHIVNGPGDRGVYTLRIDNDATHAEQAMVAALAQLRANRGVLLAEPAVVSESTGLIPPKP